MGLIESLSPDTALALADGLLGLHLAIVVFNLLMPPAILLGAWRRWAWVRNRVVRLLHLGSMAVVALQAVLGDLCFLTVWETDLRLHAGTAGHSGSFIQTLLSAILYVDAPLSVLVPIYLGWAALAVALWWLVPPRGVERLRS
ncbi:MAG: DUF2784 domain-containing protein [Xanthomonadaceae bacterium]|nr:DUF2784 domain-containing protein [Xanthomonadaceae bacterium]